MKITKNYTGYLIEHECERKIFFQILGNPNDETFMHGFYLCSYISAECIFIHTEFLLAEQIFHGIHHTYLKIFKKFN